MFTSSLQYYKILKYRTSQVRYSVQGPRQVKSQYPNRTVVKRILFYVICACVFCCNLYRHETQESTTDEAEDYEGSQGQYY